MKAKRSTLATILGTILLTVGLALGIGEARFPTLLWNSAVVTVASTTISLILGSLCGWLLGWTQVRGRTFWVALLLTWATTPLILQISAWDALWGRLSWLGALGHVNYTRWFDGLLAIIWIHGFANLPWVALLFYFSRQWVSGDLEQYALTRSGLYRTMLRCSFPRLLTLFVLSALVVGLRVFEQFEVTDVYQVRTWAEIWYLGFSLGEFDQWDGLLPSVEQLTRIVGSPFPNAVANQAPVAPPTPPAADPAFWPVLFTPVLLLAGVVCLFYGTFANYLNLRDDSEQYSLARLPLPGKSVATILVGCLGIPVLIQVGNLLIRAGMRARPGDQGPELVWSLDSFREMAGYTLVDYWDAAIWSYLIGFCSALLISVVSFLLLWTFRKRNVGNAVLLIVGITALAVPSPLLSLTIYRWINLSEITWIRELAATSILSPVLALLIKNFGLGVLIWRTILAREAAQREAFLALQPLGAFYRLWHFGIRRHAGTIVAMILFLTLLAAGDLATTFATVPPGMDTFPRRILGDLHAGAGAQVAAACLWQWLAIGLASLMLAVWVTRGKRTE